MAEPQLQLTPEQREKAHDRYLTFLMRLGDRSHDAGHKTINYSFLINGGAAVAIMALLGEAKYSEMHSLFDSILCFGIGCFCSVLGISFSYLYYFSTEAKAVLKFNKLGLEGLLDKKNRVPWYIWLFLILSMFFVLCSLICFIIGGTYILNCLFSLPTK